MLFPHEKIRDSQKELMDLVTNSLQTHSHVVVHAPTGLGKTAAVLAPAIKTAIDNDLTVFFLTSRHTQHNIVLETARAIKNKHNIQFPCTSLIGKKHMCAQDGAPPVEFHDYCKHLRDHGECHYYENYMKGDVRIELLKQQLDGKPANEIVTEAANSGLCPYEISMSATQNAKVIVADYYYLFSDTIRDPFLSKSKKELDKSIVIVDEAHNLPNRLRSVYSAQLSTKMLMYAVKEAKKFELSQPIATLSYVQDALMAVTSQEEKNVDKATFERELAISLGEAATQLSAAAELVREDQQRSSISGVARFLDAWQERENGFTRISKQEESGALLRLVCLDPGLMAKDVFDQCYASVLMSGTLNPPEMFKDILGIQAKTAIYPSPFPKENRKVLLVPLTTTKYNKRSNDMYSSIASHCDSIIQNIPGPTAVFFPSYAIRNAVLGYFSKLSARKIMIEQSGMSTNEKQGMLDQLANSKDGVLFGVSAGSFGEGVDMPGVLKGVIIAGLPLTRPDLETQGLIDLYQSKFGKGWEYGYTLPAMSKVTQNAGRCIRSETDKGVIVLLEERFGWPTYKQSLPKDWNIEITTDYEPIIKEFFG
ncbi:MAG: ATP-dependent DNA helicase [Candidatus Woesearchaeota archaeon]|jgi:DNA excision repair protein ERCC-2|nr:ATP-dependent DNA helicase [Candidatus Woesearchaeota archaeon]MDP7199234.1 ATP-dependent DNA helicase [Candidatus Woesearchaeota archaeon]MDP7467847.1 ATP-dependent DNA helicase [Candidatus Woesearchaeota archaeon]MDP7647837.1 ATP-dependent DNA helicase [Candidatus Woesearchaeota archaeon]